ncbi:cyclic-di-AMP receptor [Patescibacteria group bacterium]|nr:cyclic-di-AMP receptor [Patescibacteria group bacterium]
MKLIIIITHDENAKDLEATLLEKRYSLTKLDSVGGFLQKKNTTFLLATKKEKVDEVIELTKKVAKTKEETVSAPVFSGDGMESMLASGSQVTVEVGGAMVFVMPLERMEKI